VKRFFSLTTLITVLASSVITNQAALAQNRQEPDERIRAALERQDYKFSISQGGHFKVTVRFEGNRTQGGTIFSNTNRLGDLEIRQICTTGYITEGQIPVEIALKLLTDTSVKKIGAWEIVRSSDGRSLALFCAKVDVNIRPKDLIAVIEATLGTADRMEQELLGTDEY
jgi:hypothetical protein